MVVKIDGFALPKAGTPAGERWGLPQNAPPPQAIPTFLILFPNVSFVAFYFKDSGENPRILVLSAFIVYSIRTRSVKVFIIVVPVDYI